MSALSSCRGITEVQATRILNKDTVYCPHLPLASVSPDMVVEILMRGKGYFLWDKYDFSRLSDEQWLRLLGGITGSVRKVEEQFLVERASAVDNGQLNLVLARREELIEFVDQQFIATELAVEVLTRESGGGLWWRYDFTRFDGKQLCRLLKKTERTSDWPESLKTCFKAQGQPLTQSDLLEIAIDNPSVVIELLSTDWASAMEDDEFGELATVCVRKDNGRQAITSRLRSSSKSWKELGIEKLKQLLIAFPDAQSSVDWKSWPFATIASLIDANSTFANLNPHPIRFFFWKHAKSLAAMVALTAAAFCLIYHQNEYLAAKELQRQHWNGIVGNIRKLDQSKSYEELTAAFSGVSARDLSVVSNDVFVKNASAHLRQWKICNESAKRYIKTLREFNDGGWQTANPSEVTNLITKIEENEYTVLAIRDECARLKTAWRCAMLRGVMGEYKSQIPHVCDIQKLEGIKVAILEAKSFAELVSLASAVEKLLNKRIETLREEELSKSIVAVSNGVERIFTLLHNRGGFEVVQKIPAMRKDLIEMIGYTRYCEQCPGRFEEMTAAVEQYQSMKVDADEKMQEAKELDEQFKKEFLTVDAGTVCSNLLAACDAGVEKARRLGGWQDPIEAYHEVRRIVDGIQNRDLRCWSAVDRLNVASSFAEYLDARNSLAKACCNFTVLRKLSDPCDVQVADLNTAYPSNEASLWFGSSTYTYKFVGVIAFDPASPDNIEVSIRLEHVKETANIYTLWKTPSGKISAEKIISKRAGANYYKVNGVDYSKRQGSPLFVRSYDYVGEK